MKFKKCSIPEIVVCEPVVHYDSRGYFCESFRKDKLDEYLEYKINFCQENESKSNKGVTRGLHYQLQPFAQTKLVRVISGSILDIAVDIRVKSPTFGSYVAVEISAQNKKQILIPRGFAHGFMTLEDDTRLSYKVDSYYNKEYEYGINIQDPDINIKWPLEIDNNLMSEKDKKQPFLRGNDKLFQYGNNHYD